MTSITIVGPPSVPVMIGRVSQSSTRLSLQWTQPSRFWMETDSQPVDYLVMVSCGSNSMQAVYNDSVGVRALVFVSNLTARWQSNGEIQTVTLFPEDSGMFLLSPLPLVCQQGGNLNISVMARNRVFNSPTVSSSSLKLLAPPSQVEGLRSEEYTGGVTLFWQQVHKCVRIRSYDEDEHDSALLFLVKLCHVMLCLGYLT